MRFEVVEQAGEWIVLNDGRELARFPEQDQALNDVTERLRGADASVATSLRVRYQGRAA